MPKDWYSTSELAGLPGLPGNRSNIARKLRPSVQPHQVRPRQGRGGGFEYHYSCLPQETQAALKSEGIYKESVCDTSCNDPPPARSAPPTEPELQSSTTPMATGAPTSLFVGWAYDPTNWTTEKIYQRVSARSLILDAVNRFQQIQGLSVDAARYQFAREYNAGTLDVPGKIRELVPRISRGALAEWAARQKKGDLKPKWRGLNSALSQEQQDLILSILAAKPWLGPTGICREISAHCDQVPNKGQVWRFITNWKASNPQEWAVMENTDIARSRFNPAFGRQDNTTCPNELWEIDCTRIDLKVREGESARRWTLVALIDVHTRRANLLLTPQPQGRATMLALRRAILAWGLPSKLKLDNGKEFKNNFVLQRLGILGIKPWFCTPGQPQEKPHVERFFRTLQHGALESLPGFVGHDVLGRKNIQKSSGEPSWEISLPPEELQAWLDSWLEQYHQTRHSGINCSPLEKLAQALPNGWVQRTVDPTQLDFILLPGSTNPDGLQRIGKDGLRVAGAYFVDPSLGGRVGERVHVRFDPDDLSQVWVYNNPQLETLLCIARNADGLSNFERIAVAKKAKSEYAQIKNRVAQFRREGRKLEKTIQKNPAALLAVGSEAPAVLVRRQVERLRADLRQISAPPPPSDPIPAWDDVEIQPEPAPPPEPLHVVMTRVAEAWAEGETLDPGDCRRVAYYSASSAGQALIRCVLRSWENEKALTDYLENYKQEAV